jgi:hypothetical protein
MQYVNVIEYDEKLIGLKKDLVIKLNSQLKFMVNNKNKYNYELAEISELALLIEDIELKAKDYELIVVSESLMGTKYWKYCYIEECED